MKTHFENSSDFTDKLAPPNTSVTGTEDKLTFMGSYLAIKSYKINPGSVVHWDCPYRRLVH